MRRRCSLLTLSAWFCLAAVALCAQQAALAPRTVTLAADHATLYAAVLDACVQARVRVRFTPAAARFARAHRVSARIGPLSLDAALGSLLTEPYRHQGLTWARDTAGAYMVRIDPPLFAQPDIHLGEAFLDLLDAAGVSYAVRLDLLEGHTVRPDRERRTFAEALRRLAASAAPARVRVLKVGSITCVAPTRTAGSQELAQATLTVWLHEVSLEDALRALFAAAGAQYVLGADNLGTVTMDYGGPFRSVIEGLLRKRPDLTYRVTNRVVIVVRRDSRQIIEQPAP